MVKTLIILVLLFDGTLLKEEYPLARPMEVHECLMLADEHREAIATYREFDDARRNGYYLNDGRGTWQGVLCK
jgi:tRNA splicing endonuclease